MESAPPEITVAEPDHYYDSRLSCDRDFNQSSFRDNNSDFSDVPRGTSSSTSSSNRRVSRSLGGGGGVAIARKSLADLMGGISGELALNSNYDDSFLPAPPTGTTAASSSNRDRRAIIGGGVGGGSGEGRAGTSLADALGAVNPSTYAYDPPPPHSKSSYNIGSYDTPQQGSSRSQSPYTISSGIANASNNNISNTNPSQHFGRQLSFHSSVGMLNNSSNNSMNNICADPGAVGSVSSISSRAPFGTDAVSAVVNIAYEDYERKLTSLTSERAALDDEMQK
jgi:hypothetical protein